MEQYLKIMNKELFEKYLNSVIEFDEFIDRLYEIGIDLTECDIVMKFLSNYISILEDACGDSINGWISYWLYDLDKGKDWKCDCIIDGDGKEVKLETIDDLYDVLVENMKNDTN